MLKTLKLKLLPTRDQGAALLTTLERFNAACDWIASVAFERRLANKIALQKVVYYEVRERFGLSAQMAIRAIAKVVEAYKRDKRIRPAFRPHGAMVYDERILSFRGLEAASILTLGGRVEVPMVVCGYHAVLLANARVRGQADLAFVKGQWYLLFVAAVPDEPCAEPDDFLGVDLGIVNLAVDSDGEMFGGGDVERQRRIYAHRRRNLQHKGTKAAKRKLRQLAGKQARYQRDTNHGISKQIVRKAKDTGRGIAVEDLGGIRDRTTVRRRQRARHANWSFFQLKSFIAYKAQAAGVVVCEVDPRNTSRTCPECGVIDKASRRSQAEFLCVGCGYAAPADANAARIIRARAAVMRPMVSPPDLG
jgi:putative transposase